MNGIHPSINNGATNFFLLFKIVDRNPSMTSTAPAKSKFVARVKLRQAEAYIYNGTDKYIFATIMNRFRTSHSENQKNYFRKNQAILETLTQRFHDIGAAQTTSSSAFQTSFSQPEIIDELLRYREELRTAYHFTIITLLFR